MGLKRIAHWTITTQSEKGATWYTRFEGSEVDAKAIWPAYERGDYWHAMLLNGEGKRVDWSKAPNWEPGK